MSSQQNYSPNERFKRILYPPATRSYLRNHNYLKVDVCLLIRIA